jgi:hypothetical protein
MGKVSQTFTLQAHGPKVEIIISVEGPRRFTKQLRAGPIYTMQTLMLELCGRNGPTPYKVPVEDSPEGWYKYRCQNAVLCGYNPEKVIPKDWWNDPQRMCCEEYDRFEVGVTHRIEDEWMTRLLQMDRPQYEKATAAEILIRIFPELVQIELERIRQLHPRPRLADD